MKWTRQMQTGGRKVRALNCETEKSEAQLL